MGQRFSVWETVQDGSTLLEKWRLRKSQALRLLPEEESRTRGFDGRVEGDKVRDPTKCELIVVGCTEGCPALIQHPSKSKCV